MIRVAGHDDRLTFRGGTSIATHDEPEHEPPAGLWFTEADMAPPDPNPFPRIRLRRWR